MLDFLFSNFPTHKYYVEPFGGSGVVVLNKSIGADTFNDLNSEIHNLFLVLREDGESLLRLLELSAFSEQDWKESLKPCECRIEKARRTIVRYRNSFGGNGGSFRIQGRHVRKGILSGASSFLTAIQDLPKIISRLKHVEILNRDAISLIKSRDDPDTFFYCDPPYVPETREVKNGYDFEMTLENHAEFLKVVKSCKGKFLVSGYKSELYRDELRDWNFKEKSFVKNSSSKSKKPIAKECLWFNYEPQDRKGRLF